MLIEITNAFRAWGFAALLFALPAEWAFLRMAWRRAFESCRGADGHVACFFAFFAGAWTAGRDTNLRVNAWGAMALLTFAGGAGGAIFVSSNFLGGYSTLALNLFMLPMWAMLAASAWGIAIQTAARKARMAMASGLLLSAMLAVALSLKAQA